MDQTEKVESRDTNARQVIFANAAILTFFAVSICVLYFIFGTWSPPGAERSVRAPQLFQLEGQSGAAENNQTIKDKERLTSYGWVDRSRGKIHIPIERAMQQEVEEIRSASHE